MQAECPIILIGMMGAGKTTIGRLVSYALQCPFYDSDAVIEEEHHCDVSSFFTRYGEAAFRACEEKTVSRLVRVSPCVLAVGGGAILSRQVRRVIFQQGFVVWLRANVDVLMRRVAHSQARPLLAHKDCRETLQHLLKERRPFYEGAHVTVPVYEESPERTLRRVLRALVKRMPDTMLSHRESTHHETQVT